MQQDAGFQAEYQIFLNHLTLAGTLQFSPNFNKSSHLKLFLPPSGVFPSFQILLNGRAPVRRVGRLAVFETGGSPLKFEYEFYLPGLSSFLQLSELLPEVVSSPLPQAFTLKLDPPPTAASLEPQDGSSGFYSASREQFFHSLVSFHGVASASAPCRHCTLTAHCSSCFTAPVSEFLDYSLRIYDQCTRWLGDNGFSKLNLFFDWAEPYQLTNRVTSWNSGGNIYLLAPAHRQITLPLLLTLAHEIIHEWNGRKIFPATKREWWFLEGVTQLLAFQLISAGNIAPAASLLDLFTQAATEKVNPPLAGDLLPAAAAFPIPFSYPQSLQFAFRLEKLLRRTGHRRANLRSLLRDLLNSHGGAPFTQDSIFRLIGNYLDLNNLKEALMHPEPADTSSLLECFESADPWH